MTDEANFFMFFEKVSASVRKLQIGDPKLPRKRQVSMKKESFYKKGETPTEFVSTVKEHYSQFNYQVFVIHFIRKITSKLFRQWEPAFNLIQ